MNADHDMKSLSKQQREIAAALSDSPQTFRQIYDRVERDDCNGRPKASRWKPLVDLGIAEIDVDKYGKVCGLKRGK